jgi:hypothetical protein
MNSRTQEQLAVLTPDIAVRWMKLRACGTPDPGPDAEPTPLCCSASLQCWKKGSSFHMPHGLMHWNAMSQEGNPTKSTEVNDLIKRARKMEVRKKGKKSTAWRAIMKTEHATVIGTFEHAAEDDMFRKCLIPSLAKVQFHVIGRIDNCAQFLIENHAANPETGFTLQAKLSWSENALEERDAPNQILIGTMEPSCCPLIALAVWLEIFLGSGGSSALTPCVFGINEDLRVPEGGDKAR